MKRFHVMMIAAMLMVFTVGHAAAAQQHSNIATVTLTMGVAESITIIPPTQALVLPFTSGATSTTPATFQSTTLWQLQPTHTLLDENIWFASATAALTAGAGANIPASQVTANLNGSAYSDCARAADVLVPSAVSGSTCNVGLSIHLTSANYAAQETDTWGIQLQGLPTTLPAGNYAGTLNMQAGTN